MRWRWLAAVAAVALTAAACTGGDGEAISQPAADALQQHFAALRTAVDAEEADAAQEALNVLRREARSRADAGEIDDNRLTTIEAAIDDVRARLSQLEAAPSPPPTPPPA
ncbi:MAG: hypothetical protein BRC31_07900, partial [Actinobacteria bacterium QS_5_72_10]